MDRLVWVCAQAVALARFEDPPAWDSLFVVRKRGERETGKMKNYELRMGKSKEREGEKGCRGERENERLQLRIVNEALQL
jgi:hypothetical protein